MLCSTFFANIKQNVLFQMPRSYTFTNKENDKLLSGSEQGVGRFLYLASKACGAQGQKWYLDEGNAIRTNDNLVPKQGGMSDSKQENIIALKIYITCNNITHDCVIRLKKS